MFELDYVRIMQIVGYMNCWILHVVIIMNYHNSGSCIQTTYFKLTVYHALNDHHNGP